VGSSSCSITCRACNARPRQQTPLATKGKQNSRTLRLTRPNKLLLLLLLLLAVPLLLPSQMRDWATVAPAVDA
jgi:hypothetical protein